MKRSGRIYIIAGVVLALLAGALLFVYLNQLTSQSANAQPTATPIPNVDVVVVAKELKPGMIITGDMIRRDTRKATEVSPDTVREVSEALDRMVVLETKAGTVLKRGDVQTVPFVLPKGKRAMALPVDDMSSIAGLVRENDFIDVVVTGKIKLDKPGEAQGTPGARPTPTPRPQGSNANVEGLSAIEPTDNQTVVKAVLQRIQVLKIVAPQPPQPQQQGRQAQAAPDVPPATATAQARAQAEAEQKQGRITGALGIVVLAVNNQEAELLRYARDAGGFQLLLRGRDDADKEETKGMTLDILIRDYGLPVPKPVLVDRRPE